MFSTSSRKLYHFYTFSENLQYKDMTLFPVIGIPARVSSEGIILVYNFINSSQKSQMSSAFHL